MTSSRGDEGEIGRGAKAREALIVAALKILETKSIDAITTREIAAKCKQNISAIAYYFGGKEGLYLAAVEHVTDVIRASLVPVLHEVEAYLGGDKWTPDGAVERLKKLLRTTIALHKDTLGFTEIIAREQIHPTQAFSILYDGVLLELQTGGARLIAAAVGGDQKDREYKIRFHALLGEAVIFRFARETIMRGVGWSDIGAKENKIISALIEEHVDLMLAGLRAKRGK